MTTATERNKIIRVQDQRSEEVEKVSDDVRPPKIQDPDYRRVVHTENEEQPSSRNDGYQLVGPQGTKSLQQKTISCDTEEDKVPKNGLAGESRPREKPHKQRPSLDMAIQLAVGEDKPSSKFFDYVNGRSVLK